MTSHLKWCKIHPQGEVMPPAYPKDAGFDMVVSRLVSLRPMWMGMGLSDAAYTSGAKYAYAPTDVPCGVRIALPEGIAALVIARSSAVKRGIMVIPTLIDPGYRGDMYVFAYNMTPKPITLLEGTRIAQIVPMAAVGQDIKLIEVTDTELPAGDRGNAGFGSTGGAEYG